MVFQRINNKGVQIGDAFFAVIAFSMFLVAIGVIISENNDAYNMDVTNDLTQYSRLDEVSSLAQDQRESISPNDPEPSENAEANTFRGGYGIITGTLSSLNIIFGSSGVFTSLATRFGIPNYVIIGMLSFMIFGLIFAIIAIVFRLARSRA